MTGDGSPSPGFAGATENLRAATRWLLTAAAAAGAAIAAGLQLTDIGSLTLKDWPRLAIAGASLAASFGSVGYMILRTSRLLADEWITLAQLEMEQFKQLLRRSDRRRDRRRAEAIDRIYRELSECRDELYGSVADSITDLYRKLIKANDAARLSPGADQAQEAARLKSAVDMVVQTANYSYLRADFTALRKHLALAGTVFAVGVVAFAYAASPPASPGKTAARPVAHSATPASSSSPHPRGQRPPGQARPERWPS